jgi:hypothetical protein
MNDTREALTQEEVKKQFYYNPETGILTRMSGKFNGKAQSCKDSNGYVMTYCNGKSYKAHRLIWLYLYGYFPSEIDHINSIKDDNRKINLRDCTKSLNHYNRITKSKKSGIRAKGVTKNGEHFRVEIYVNKTRISLGTYKTEDEAAHEYNKAAIKHCGEFARINPIGVDYEK